MPEISRFYGIVIKMFFEPKEHVPRHLRVQGYGGDRRRLSEKVTKTRERMDEEEP